MKRNEAMSPDYQAMCHIITIPQKMLQLHDDDHLAEYILQDLSQKNCLNFQKAAYFVDNPDFDCLKGIAGYSCTEPDFIHEKFWKNPKGGKEALQKSPFNTQVRSYLRASHKRGALADHHLVQEVADQLGMQHPQYCTWTMKHDNHGILMYQYANEEEAPSAHCVLSGACLLSFCTIH